MRGHIGGRMTLAALLFVLGLGVIMGLILGAPAHLLGPLSAERNESQGVKLSVATSQEGQPLESPFKGIYQRAAPAVVFVEVKRKATAEDLDQFHQGTPFDEMFRRMFPQERGPVVVPSSASGFFIDKRGYILTNNHVVEGANQVRVRLSDERQLDAEIVGADPESDVAVLRVKGDDSFPALPLGNSDEVEVGDWAIAVGNPFGTLQRSLTVGVVSAKGRSNLNIMGGTPAYQDFIQTDASINFGNSGGPLLNARGEVIGVNTAINAAGQGIGFAIPINMAREVAEHLINEGRVVRGYIGIYPQEITQELAEGLGLTAHQGILVGKVLDGGPAQEAGLETGDVIVKFAGEDVGDVAKFRFLVASQPVDRKVSVVYVRNGQRKETRIDVAERKEEQIARSGAPAQEEWLGIEVQEVAGADAERVGLKSGDRAVVVTDVTSGSPADDAGLAPGDIIRRVGDERIRSLGDYRQAMEHTSKQSTPIVLLIERNGVTQYAAVRPGKK